MINGNAKKVSRILRGALPNGVNQSAVLACAIAYALPIPTDSCGCLTAKASVHYKLNFTDRIAACISEINEIHLVEAGFVLERTKETYEARVSALVKPILTPMSVTANFGAVELDAVEALVEILRSEFTGA